MEEALAVDEAEDEGARNVPREVVFGRFGLADGSSDGGQACVKTSCQQQDFPSQVLDTYPLGASRRLDGRVWRCHDRESGAVISERYRGEIDVGVPWRLARLMCRWKKGVNKGYKRW